MNISKIAVKRPVTTIMVILIAIAFGALSIMNLKLDMMPNMNIPIAVASTSYSGTGPEEIEKLITEPLEGVLGTVPGIKNMTSTSSYGSSIIILEFEDNTDIDIAALDMRERVDLIKPYLPEAADDTMVIKIDMNSMSSLQIGISSGKYDLVELKKIVEDKISGRLKRQDGVAQVNIVGGREKEISITLKEEMLRGYGISESQIMQLLMAENRNTPTGTIKQGDKTLQLRVVGEFEDLDEIRRLPISTAATASLFLSDIADVEETYKENTSLSYINGVPSVTLSIQKQSTANTVNVSDAVIKELENLRADMPDIAFKVLLDPADFIRFTLSTVVSSALSGGVLAIIVLYVFLRNLRSTLIVAASMPISIITTFVLMYYANITLNVMSLGGLALGIGMLVDNSIVVLESIFRKIEEGCDPVTGSIEGAREVGSAVMSSTLTTVAVFIPITFSGGLTAQIFNQLALTIAFSLLSSLVVALTFVPMACSLLLRNLDSSSMSSGAESGQRPRRKWDFMGALLDGIENGYSALLKAALKHKIITLLITSAFVAATFYTMQYVPQEFMPETDESGVSISISMPKGALLLETEKTANAVIDKIKGFPEITDITLNVGSSGSSFSGSSGDRAQIIVSLVDKNSREKSSDDIAREMDKILKSVAGAEISVAAQASSMGNMATNDIELLIKGDNMEVLSNISIEIADLIKTIAGTREVKSSIGDTSPQATIKINRMKASSYGISAASVASIVNTAVSGSVVTTYKVDGDELDIRIRQDKSRLDYIADIENILIPAPTGINIPIYELAEISIKNLPVAIERNNQVECVSVTSKMDGRSNGEISGDITTLLAAYPMPDGYSWEFTGSSQRMNDTFSNLGMVLIISVFLVYMIIAAQFESLLYPFIVLFSIPIALTGGIFGLYAMGISLSITSYLGLIMLAGVVINNAIVLVDYANLLVRERGMNAYDALMLAGPVRLRPILMSTLTTVLGLAPMMYSNGQGAELMAGLSTVVVFGLSLSTLVTLLLIPTIYLIFDNIKHKIKG